MIHIITFITYHLFWLQQASCRFWQFGACRKVWESLDRYIFACMEPAAQISHATTRYDMLRHAATWGKQTADSLLDTRHITFFKHLNCSNDVLKLLSNYSAGNALEKKDTLRTCTCDDHTNAYQIMWGWQETSDQIDRTYTQRYVAICGNSNRIWDAMRRHWMPCNATSCHCVIVKVQCFGDEVFRSLLTSKSWN